MSSKLGFSRIVTDHIRIDGRRFHNIRPDVMKQFLSSTESNDRKPFDYQRILTEAFLKELAEKIAVSIIQTTQSRISYPFSLMCTV
jgi:hypothetical protein